LLRARSRMVCVSLRKSFLLPTKIMGTFGQKWRTSSNFLMPLTCFFFELVIFSYTLYEHMNFVNVPMNFVKVTPTLGLQMQWRSRQGVLTFNVYFRVSKHASIFAFRHDYVWL
jgi:hypothetical protein